MAGDRASNWLFRSLLVLVTSLPGCRALAAEQAEIAAPTAWQVYLSFEQSCVECHGGHLARPKGKFGHILDLRRLIADGKIVPGSPESSDLFFALVSTDEDERMPPPDSEGPPLTDAQIEEIRAWIAAGALIDAGAAPPPGPDASASAAATKPAASRPLGQIIGRFHPLVVHFPIALLLTACVTELLSRFRPAHAAWAQGATRASLWGAAGGAIVAAVCGWLHAPYEGFAEGVVFSHRWLGVATAGLAVIAFAISEYAERASTRGSRHLLLAVLVVTAVVVTLAGHTGGLLAYGDDYFTWRG